MFAGVPPGPRELLARVLESPSRCGELRNLSGPRLARPRRWGWMGEAASGVIRQGLQSVFLLLPLLAVVTPESMEVWTG